MDINNILNGVECACGKIHHCDIEYVHIEAGAIARLEKLCDKKENILMVADENTYSAAGEYVEKALCRKTVKKVIFPGKTVLIPNEDAIERVRVDLDGADLILGIGSGVIQDLCKYVAFFSKIPYIIVATAPSMDGYASDGAAMILNGMKETVKAGLPKAIIADTEVLKDAPMEMIKAGYGDIIGKFSALCDWKLSTEINGEYFCKYIYDTTYDMIKNTLGTAKGLLVRDLKSIKALMEGLIVVGIMMSFAGSSRPASGSEHHLSHFFEIVGIVEGKPYLAHGIDVAYSTVITADIREKVVKSAFPDELYRESKTAYAKNMKKIYKTVAEGCMALQDEVGNYNVDRLDIYKAKEQKIKEILSEMPSSERIKDMLGMAEFDMSEFYATYSEEKIQNAISYAKDLKDRYTVLWLYYDLFGGRMNEA